MKEIELPSKDRIISELRQERDELKSLLEDIIYGDSIKKRKAIDDAKLIFDMIYNYVPMKNCEFWNW